MWTWRRKSKADAKEPETAFEEAQQSFWSYVETSKQNRFRTQLSQVVLVVVSASVPIAGVLTPNDSRLAAILGAVVVALTALRAGFHWHDNWTRSSLACAMIVAEMRLYKQGAFPYDDPNTRDGRLVRAVNNVEIDETRQWTAQIAAAASVPQTNACQTL